MLVELHKATPLRSTCMAIHIDLARFALARTIIDNVLTKFGPTHNPELKGIPHLVSEHQTFGRIIVDFPNWETEWAGSWNDLRIMVAQIADHLNLDVEIEK